MNKVALETWNVAVFDCACGTVDGGGFFLISYIGRTGPANKNIEIYMGHQPRHTPR
jgi:hypothetical protein